jgi:hypothetical protein
MQKTAGLQSTKQECEYSALGMIVFILPFENLPP